MKILSISLVLLSSAIVFIHCTSPNKEKDTDKKVETSSDLFAPIENLSDIYWNLIELNGKAVTAYPTQNREPFIMLKRNREVESSGGCNAMGGTYTSGENKQITFSQMRSTKMACPDMTLETDYHAAIEKIRSYESDGKVLTFYDEAKVPIAKFESARN